MVGGALDRDLPVVPGVTVLGTLGHGGSAVVLLARQEELDRLVAVKVIERDIADPKLWRDFQREAHAIARLSGHPNVVAVYTTGRTEAGHPFLVSEYLDRGSLADIIEAQGPLPPLEVVRIGVAVANALTAAHGVGIMHRDLKPGNVLLDRRGAVKLADFGIARLVAHNAFTTTGTLTFTPEHVAPELLRGVPEGPGTDVYGLASTLITALIGHSPFGSRRNGESIEAMLLRKLTAWPPPVPAGVPPALAESLRLAMHPEPDRRPTLGELRATLIDATQHVVTPPADDVVGTRETPAQGLDGRLTPAYDLPPPPRRSRAPLVAAAIVLVAAGATALFLRDGETAGDTGTTVATTQVSVDLTTTAPQTTVAATTATPTSAADTTAAPTTLPPAAPAAIDAADAEAFLRAYYVIVAARDYETSWSMLSPAYQAEGPGTFDAYVSFWDSVEAVEVLGVQVLPPGDDPSRTVVQLQMRYVIGGAASEEVDEIGLIVGADGRPLIDTYRVVA